MTAPTITGSITQIQDSTTPSSQSVSIPADAELCIVAIAFFRGVGGGGALSTLTLDGNSFTSVVKSNDSGFGTTTIWRYIVPVGLRGTSKTLAWAFDGALTEGANIFVIWLKDVDTGGDPIRGSNFGAGDPTATSGSYSSDANDLNLCVGYSFSTTDCDASGSGQTEQADSTQFNSCQGAVGTKAGVAGTTTMVVSGDFCSVCACSIKGSGAVAPLIPIYVNALETDITVATVSPVVNAPSGILDGDLVLIFIVTNTGSNVAAPAGWAIAGTEIDNGSDMTTALIYKIAAGEGASWTLTNLFAATEIGRFVVIVYRNVNKSFPINAVNQAASGTVTTLSGPSITPLLDGCMIVQFAGADPGTGAYAMTPDTSPVGVERFDGKDASSNAYVAIQEYLQATKATIALDMTGLTSDVYNNHQIAIAPPQLAGKPRVINQAVQRAAVW